MNSIKTDLDKIIDLIDYFINISYNEKKYFVLLKFYLDNYIKDNSQFNWYLLKSYLCKLLKQEELNDYYKDLLLIISKKLYSFNLLFNKNNIKYNSICFKKIPTINYTYNNSTFNYFYNKYY